MLSLGNKQSIKQSNLRVEGENSLLTVITVKPKTYKN